MHFSQLQHIFPEIADRVNHFRRQIKCSGFNQTMELNSWLKNDKLLMIIRHFQFLFFWWCLLAAFVLLRHFRTFVCENHLIEIEMSWNLVSWTRVQIATPLPSFWKCIAFALVGSYSNHSDEISVTPFCAPVTNTIEVPLRCFLKRPVNTLQSYITALRLEQRPSSFTALFKQHPSIIHSVIGVPKLFDQDFFPTNIQQFWSNFVKGKKQTCRELCVYQKLNW